MLKTYKYRIYPSQKQRELLAKHFGACRWVWNWALAKKIEAYQKEQRQISRYELSAKLPLIKKEYPWLREVNAQSLQQILVGIESSFRNFFRRKHGFPKFKSKKSYASCKFPQNCKVNFEDETITVYKIQNIKIRFDRIFDGLIKQITLIKDKSGKYYAAILVEEKKDTSKYSKGTESIGIDLGINHFAVLSTGEKIDNPRFLKSSLENIAKHDRRLQRKKTGSKNREKQRIKVAKAYEKVKFQRQDFIHKLSTRLIRENQAIILEDLNVKGMMKNRRLSRAIGDAGWGEFNRQLEYKADWYEKTIIKIGRFEPSSRLCTCGIINRELALRDRIWTCKHCGVTHDRDILAANNIKKIGWGTSEFTPVETECSKASRRSRNKVLSV